MTISDKEILWSGIAIALWVIYQSVTGGFAYKGRGFRREDNPPLFWGAMTFEALFAVSCISMSLGLTALMMTAFGLCFLMPIGYLAWFFQMAVRRIRKYPSISRHFMADRPQEAARELGTLLAAHPGNREVTFMLAGAYEKMGEHIAACELYTNLAQTGDNWGREARAFLRKRSNETGPRGKIRRGQ